MAATSLRLPEDLKRPIERLANAANKTPHAFMVEALAREAERSALRARFADEAARSEEEAFSSGRSFELAATSRPRSASPARTRYCGKPWFSRALRHPTLHHAQHREYPDSVVWPKRRSVDLFHVETQFLRHRKPQASCSLKSATERRKSHAAGRTKNSK